MLMMFELGGRGGLLYTIPRALSTVFPCVSDQGTLPAIPMSAYHARPSMNSTFIRRSHVMRLNHIERYSGSWMLRTASAEI